MPFVALRHDMAALARRFAEMPDRLEQGLAEAQLARSLVPVDSGELRASISAASERRLDARVTANAPYAAMVEYGTSKMAARSYMLPAAQAAAEPFFEAAARAAGEAMK